MRGSAELRRQGSKALTTTYWNLGSSDLLQDWSNLGLITSNNDWSGVPSIMGFRGDGLLSGTGVDPRTVTGTSTVVSVSANQANPNTFTTGGVAEFQIANPTIGLTGSGTAAAPYLALYLDATGRQGVTLSFTLRDLENGVDNAVQQVAVQYRLGDTGAWSNVPGGYVADATSGPNSFGADIPVSVTLPSDANNAATLQVRVITTNAVGNDEWVGVDDIKVTSNGSVGVVPGVLSISDASTTEGDAGSQMIDFTVSRVGGASGAVEATYSVLLPGGNGGADANDFGTTAFTGVVSFADGQSTATISLPVLGDHAPEPNETFSITLSNATGGATIDRATATGTILNDDILPLQIGQIQGEGQRSAFEGQTIVTEGIITAVDSNGFYIQDRGDGNSRTSDAVFVFTGAAPQDVFLGDLVSVQGVVNEFRAGTGGLSVTQISAPIVNFVASDYQLPDAVLIGEGGLTPPSRVIDNDGLTSYDPTTDGIDFWESLEGMRVTIDAPLVVSNTTSDTFAETDVVASLGKGATGINDRGGITISDGDFNPEKIQLQGDRTIFAGFTAGYSIGDQLSSVTGIVNYAAARYEVLVTEAVTVTKDVSLAREVTTLTGDATHLSMATYNVENLDPSDGKFDVLASNIVYNLRAPDIIALQEIQDADGAGNGSDYSGVKTAQGLIDAIAAIDGGRYGYVEVAPTANNTTGGEPNGNIRGGYLYNLDRVTYVEGSAELIDGPAYNNTRKPLVADFLFHGETVTAINVHLTSRGGSDPLWGATQPPADAGDAARTAQAAGVKAYINAHLADDPDLNIAVLGDWNGFAWEEAQTQLTDPAKGGAMTDLATLLSVEERYSYMFEGNAQQLDHILVTDSLAANAQYDAVHINAQFGGDRPTDHDPQLAVFDFGNVIARTTVASVEQDSGMHQGFDFGTAPVAATADDVFAWEPDAVAAVTQDGAGSTAGPQVDSFGYDHHLYALTSVDDIHLV